MSDFINANSLMTLIPTRPSPQRQKPVSYTPQKWEEMRPLIERLYRDRQLEDVINIMSQQHGHHATKKMYKYRITKWGLDTKNLKHTDMLYILHKQERRAAVGKDTKSVLRGRVIDREELIRFFKRKGGVQKSSDLLQTTPPSTPPYITCSTPLPQLSPITDSTLPVVMSGGLHDDLGQPTDVEMAVASSEATTANDQDLSLNTQNYESSNDYAVSYISADLFREVLAHTPPTPGHLRPPHIYYAPEMLFRNIQDYVIGSTGSQTWEPDDYDWCANPQKFTGGPYDLSNMYIYCAIASQFYEDGLCADAFKSISHVCRLLRNNSDNQHPSTLSRLFEILLKLIVTKCAHFSTILIQFLASLASVSSARHSIQDYWKRTWKLLASLPPSQCREAIARSWECLDTTFSQQREGLSPTTIAIHTDYLAEVVSVEKPGEVVGLLQSLLLEVKGLYGLNHKYALDIKAAICNILFRQRRYMLCIELANGIRQRAHSSGDFSMEVCIMDTIWIAHDVLGNMELAEEILMELAEIFTRGLGLTHPSTISIWHSLEHFYRKWGRVSEADDLMKTISRTLAVQEVDDVNVEVHQA